MSIWIARASEMKMYVIAISGKERRRARPRRRLPASMTTSRGVSAMVLVRSQIEGQRRGGDGSGGRWFKSGSSDSEEGGKGRGARGDGRSW
ncbi:hypothetical protein U1Q18_014701 [Sarracenia purpurea var. burkii]